MTRIKPKHILFCLFVLLCYKKQAYCQTNSFKIDSADFVWTRTVNKGDMAFIMSVSDDCIMLQNYLETTDTLYFDMNGNKTQACSGHFVEKHTAHLLNYNKSESRMHDSLKGASSIYCKIAQQDTSVINNIRLEIFRRQYRGVDNEFILHFRDDTMNNYKLVFPTNSNVGAISVNDIISINSTFVLVSFWYYKRMEQSSTQLGLLNLSKYLSHKTKQTK